MGNIKLGVIADDFTGASDAASFLVKAGYRVILLTDIRAVKTLDCDCVVVAQKIRSVAPQRGDSPGAGSSGAVPGAGRGEGIL